MNLDFGFDSGVINGTVKGLEIAFNSQDVSSCFNVASMLLGCAIGAFFAGRLADKYGRRSMLVISAILFVVSAWGSGIANAFSVFIIFRIIGGLAVGAASVMAPAYISEIAPAKYRGALSTIQQVAIISGLFVSFLSNYFLADLSGSSENLLWWNYETWRWMFWMELIPALSFLILLFFIPESPRYLVAQNQNKKAQVVLSKLYDKETAQIKISEIQASLETEHKPSLSDLFDFIKKRIKPIVWVGVGLAVFQQLVGINVVFYYGAVLWQSVGYGESDALLINVLSGGLSIVAVIVAIVLVDRVGRKPLLLIGSIGMTITLALLVYAFSNGTVNLNGDLALSNSIGLLALISANAYVVFFNSSWGPIMWVMLGEMFPNQIRGSGLAVSGLAQWISNFAITLSFPVLLNSTGLSSAYSFYTICAFISIFFVFRYVKETKGIELEQMTE